MLTLEEVDRSTILRVRTGSELYGTAVTEGSDRDEMGVCIPPPGYVLGLRSFEQYEHHTAWDRPGGRANRSGPGDLDLKVYSLRKFMSLALKGNPAMIELLFAPPELTVTQTPLGRELQRLAPRIVSKEAAGRYIGYLVSQCSRMLAKNGKGDDVSRPELMKEFGFDVKFAAHMARLGYQGRELIETGRLTLPMPEWQRENVRAIRRGELSMEACLVLSDNLVDEIRRAEEKSALRAHPDHASVEAWLAKAHEQHWKRMREAY